ncbi:hypothetical protein DSO57_1011396 [Entomophthora muscae]|uniref:Uncharacterized protein n=1 Tax=Entomophthora muscae TaxID=34485 RepID=A0ACC2UFV6_9FUNG|nr:hypothetical protein DSO57_1011396 [Entomophthora muscae]
MIPLLAPQVLFKQFGEGKGGWQQIPHVLGSAPGDTTEQPEGKETRSAELGNHQGTLGACGALTVI